MFLQNTNSNDKHYDNKEKAQKKTKLHNCKFQNITQQAMTKNGWMDGCGVLQINKSYRYR